MATDPLVLNKTKKVYDDTKFINSTAISSPTTDSVAHQVQFIEKTATSSPQANSMAHRIEDIQTTVDAIGTGAYHAQVTQNFVAASGVDITGYSADNAFVPEEECIGAETASVAVGHDTVTAVDTLIVGAAASGSPVIKEIYIDCYATATTTQTGAVTSANVKWQIGAGASPGTWYDVTSYISRNHSGNTLHFRAKGGWQNSNITTLPFTIRCAGSYSNVNGAGSGSATVKTYSRSWIRVGYTG